MADLNDFLNFEEDSNEFSREYENINRCDGSPSSEEAELSLSNSISALSAVSQPEVDLEMCDFTLSTSMGSWDGVSDSFSQMQVKTEPTETDSSTLALPGSWPVNPVKALKSGPSVAKPSSKSDSRTLHPSSFTMSQIAPPSLPAERSPSTSSSICSESIKEEKDTDLHDADAVEPSKKRRASETVRKGPTTSKTGHKRSSSSISTTRVPLSTSTPAVGVELDASGDPIVAKRQDRLMRNRAAALASRERKREHVMRLETSVVDLQNEKNELIAQMNKMNDEIKRMKLKMADHGIQDDPEEFIIPDAAIKTEDTPEAAQEEVAPENPALAKARTAPTGFSPRGALKKSQILANQVAAEEHLRNVTMRQAGLVPPPPSENPQSVNTKTVDSPACDKALVSGIEKPGRSSGSLIMILIFGIALFASIPPQGSPNGKPAGLAGWSTDSTKPGLLLDLPASLTNACPETVISQLRRQGFMVAEELEEQGLSPFISSSSSNPGKKVDDWPSKLSSMIGKDYMIAKQPLTANSVGGKFNIIARDMEAEVSGPAQVVTRRRASQIDKSQVDQAAAKHREEGSKCKWSVVECEVTKVESMSAMT